MTALGNAADAKSAVVGIDIGSSYIKTQVFEVSTGEGGQLTFKDRGSPYPNNKPRPSVVSGTKHSLQQWQLSTRSGAHHKKRMNYCRSSSNQQFQFINPKRCFLVKHDEVDAASLARDTGLPPEAAEADCEGYIRMNITCGGVRNTVAMNDVFGAMVYDVFVDVHNLNMYNSILGVAVTLPNTVSRAARARAYSIVWEQLHLFTSSLLSKNQKPPYIALIPEGVAATREACTTLSKELLQSPLRVMTVDSGHSTLDASQMTVSQANGVFSMTGVINTGNAFCGVKDMAHALLGKLPAEELQRAAADAAGSGKLRSVNDVLDYVDECVVAASESGPPDEYVSSSSQSYELSEAAPVKRAEVAEASKVLSGPGEQVIKRNLLLSQLAGHDPPKYAFTTGGGGLVPSLISAVQQALPADTQICRSQGGNRQSVARGAALLLFDGLQKSHQQAGPSIAAAEAAESSRGFSAEASDLGRLLPDYWTGPLGCHIAVWSTFTPSKVASIRNIAQLQELKQRIAPAAMQNGTAPGSDPQPDLELRHQHLQQMHSYIDYWIARLTWQHNVPKELRALHGLMGSTAPVVDREIPIYYSLILPQTMLPCGPAKLPWKLYRPEGCDELRLQLVRIDPLHTENEIFAGDYSVPAPEPSQCVQMSVSVDAEGKLKCEAVLHRHGAKHSDHGQPLPVTTNHDQYAAQRLDRQRRVHQLPAHVQHFLRQLNGEEAAAVAPLHTQLAAPPLPPPSAAAAAAPQLNQARLQQTQGESPPVPNPQPSLPAADVDVTAQAACGGFDEAFPPPGGMPAAPAEADNSVAQLRSIHGALVFPSFADSSCKASGKAHNVALKKEQPASASDVSAKAADETAHTKSKRKVLQPPAVQHAAKSVKGGQQSVVPADADCDLASLTVGYQAVFMHHDFQDAEVQQPQVAKSRAGNQGRSWGKSADTFATIAAEVTSVIPAPGVSAPGGAAAVRNMALSDGGQSIGRKRQQAVQAEMEKHQTGIHNPARRPRRR